MAIIPSMLLKINGILVIYAKYPEFSSEVLFIQSIFD